MQLLVIFTFFISIVWAAPVPKARFFGDILDRLKGDKSASTTALSPADLSDRFSRAAYFSRAVYCSSESITTLTCGDACTALGNDVEFLLTGGDQGAIPFFLVAHDKSTDSIVVAHQGTDPDNIMSILNDVEFFLEDIKPEFIGNADDDVKVHSGFQYAFDRTANEILNATMSALESTGSKNLLITGHSLGAAIATFDALMFTQALSGSDVTVTTTLFGTPRVGNQEFADFTDVQLGDTLTRVTNQADPVPLLPPRFLKFNHPAGEIHINAVDASGNAVDVLKCDGQENKSCSDKRNIFESDVENHLGPYFENILFGSDQCY